MSDDGSDTNNETKESKILECRACLQIMTTDSVLFNVFESWNPPWDGMGNTIAEDIAQLAQVQICETDRHSKVICEMCYQLLHSACNFTATVRKNDQLLHHRFPLDEKEFSDTVWPKPIQVDKSINCSMQQDGSMNVEIKQELVSDDEFEINGGYDNKEDFPELDIKIEPEEITQQVPSQQYTVNGALPLKHLTDDVSHLTNGNSSEHLETKIKEEQFSEDEDPEQMQSDLPLECLLCAKDFNSVTGLKAHVIAQHSYKTVKRKTDNSISPERNKCKYVCAICRRIFTTSTDLMVHETCHNKSVCYGCNESFDSFVQLTKHRQTCKAIASQEVKKLKTLDDVLRPPHDQETRLKCSMCEETFTDVYYVNIHKEIHHPSLNEMENSRNDSAMDVDNLGSIFTDSNS